MNLELARKGLTANDIETVCAALKVMKKAGALSDLPYVIPLVKNNHAIVRKGAVDTICFLIREKLVTNFHDLAPEVRKKLGTLMQSLDPSIVKEIAQDIFSDNETRRLRAVQILGLLKKNPQIHSILCNLITDKDEKIRATAVNLLASIIGPQDHEIILRLLNDKDKRVRANTVEALEKLGNKRMVPILNRFRKDLNNRIRGNVLKALHTLDGVDIEADLFEMLSTDNNFMKASALWVINQTQVCSKRLEDAAGHCIISNDQMVRSNAEKALSILNTPRARGYIHYLSNR